MTEKRENGTNVVVDNIFAYNIALDIIFENEDHEPKSIKNVDRERLVVFVERNN